MTHQPASLSVYLFGKEFHTDGATSEHITSGNDGGNNSYKRRVKWKCVLRKRKNKGLRIQLFKVNKHHKMKMYLLIYEVGYNACTYRKQAL